MFPLEENDENLYEGLPLLQEDKILDDLLAENAAAAAVVLDPEGNNVNDVIITDAKKKQREGEGSTSKEANRKAMHRNVERQRRQQMPGLYASLRSLLPLEYVKGKRAVSDHMYEAVKYIKHMQMKIEGMQTRRDKLRSLLSGGVHNYEGPTNNIISDDFVKVNLSGDEVEILITSGQNFLISKVLLELLGIGLDIVGCLSTRSFNDQFLHKIQIQASDLTCDDLPELQQRLASVIEMG